VIRGIRRRRHHARHRKDPVVANPEWPGDDDETLHEVMRSARRDSARQLARLNQGSRWLGYGPPGPNAGVVWLREHRPPLDETTDQLAGSYPFVAGSGLPYFGQYHGVDRLSGSAFGWDGQVAYAQKIVSNPSLVSYGVIGSGKSMGAKSILWRGMPFGRKWAVPGDVRGEYSALCRAAGSQPIVLGPGSPMRFSPLATPRRPPGIHESFWRETVANHRATTLSSLATAALQRELTPSEKTALDLALRSAVRDDGDPARWQQPTLGAISTWLLDPPRDVLSRELIPNIDRFVDSTYDLALTLRLLVRGVFAGVIDVDDTATIDTSRPAVVIDMSRLQLDDASLALVVTCTQAAIELGVQFDPAVWTICYDEVWRYMRFYGLVGRLANRIKVVRDLVGGIPLLIAHRPSDWTTGDPVLDAIAEGMLKDIDVHVLHRQSAIEAQTAGRMLSLTSTVVEMLTALDQGSAVWRIVDRKGVSHHLVVDHIIDPNGAEWPIMQTDSALVDDYRQIAEAGRQMTVLLNKQRRVPAA
jgi:hypothetical protein